jgi:hypothetical protein
MIDESSTLLLSPCPEGKSSSAMSLLQTVSSIKDGTLAGVVCPIVTRLGILTIPAASLLAGEVVLSYVLHHGIILPSPIGVELMEFPAKMIYILERKKIAVWKLRLRFHARMNQ